MKKHSVLAARPVDPTVAEILSIVGTLVAKENIQYLLIGATARDILLTHVFGIEVGRVTRDIDLAIAVNDWAQFEKLKQSLIDTSRFIAVPAVPSRLYFESGTAPRYPVDLIPFGGVENNAHLIAWPPDAAVLMSVAGYAEVISAAEIVEIKPGVEIPVVSLAGLAILKLFAWRNRGLENHKDAQDLFFLMRAYGSAGNVDRLYGEESDLLDQSGFDLDSAGAMLLGKDVAAIASVVTRTQLHSLLDDPLQIDRLRLHMATPHVSAIASDTRESEVLSKFVAGFELSCAE